MDSIDGRSMDKFAALEARMSARKPGGSGLVPPPESVSIGFTGLSELSNPGSDSVASPAAEPPSAGSGGLGSMMSAQKRKRSSVDVSAEAAHTPPPHAAATNSGSLAAWVSQPLQPAPATPTAAAAAATAATAPAPNSASSSSLEAELVASRRLAAERAAELEVARGELLAEQQAAAPLRGELEAARGELDLTKVELEAARGAIGGMRAEIGSIRDKQEAEAAAQQKGREALRSALRERCFRSRAEAKERLARESVRLGTLEPGKAFSTGWVQKDGTALVMLKERERGQEARRATLEEDKKAMRKRRPKGAAATGAAAESTADATTAAIELADLEESLNLRGSLLAKERAELAAERKQLEREAQVAEPRSPLCGAATDTRTPARTHTRTHARTQGAHTLSSPATGSLQRAAAHAAARVAGAGVAARLPLTPRERRHHV